MAELRLAAAGRPCVGKIGERFGHSFKPITDGDGDGLGWVCRRCGLTFLLDGPSARIDGSGATL